jgi:hypothetical protein
MPIDALTRAFGAGCGRVKDEHQREHGGSNSGEHGGASLFLHLGFLRVRAGSSTPHTPHFDNAAARPIKVVSDEAENRRGTRCNL